MARDKFGRQIPDAPQRVGYLSRLLPFNAPSDFPDAPHNLPANRNRPPLRQFDSGVVAAIDPAGPGGAGAVPSAGPLVAPDRSTVYDPHHYAKMISQTNFSAPNVLNSPSQLFLPINANNRNMLILRNASAAANLYIEFGHPADTSSTVRLTPNQMILLDEVVWQDDLYCYADAAAGVLSFSYSTIAA